MSKGPWHEVPHVWTTESKFWSWIRSGLRSVWTSHPVKLEFIKKFRIKVKNPNPDARVAEVWGMRCVKCKGCFPLPVKKEVRLKIEAHTKEPFNYIEINHKEEAGSLKTKEDLAKFASNLLYVTFDDLESLCKKCHSATTYSMRMGISEDDAKLEKKAINIINTMGDKEFLRSVGLPIGSNAKARRKQIVDYLRITP
jgi:hypothetical protein